MERYNKKRIEEEVIRTMTISRYTAVRYLSTIVFFISLYRMIGSFLAKSLGVIIIPFIIGLNQILINGEIYRAMKFRNDGRLNFTIKLLSISLILTTISLILTGINYKIMFPYLTSKAFALILVGLAGLLSLISLLKAINIKNDDDKISKKIKEYKNKRG
ncbi:MAG: hypothetical protein Q4D88_00495 [Anaerococcus sp.]|nr:hypothetical protein [Anaerococcus sp.]